MKATPLRNADPSDYPIDIKLVTARQRDILGLVSRGHKNREIANILKISVRTVEVHRFNLMKRLNVKNVAQLLKRALQFGLIHLPSTELRRNDFFSAKRIRRLRNV